MEQQTNTTDWLAKEEETFKQVTNQEFEKLPGLKLVQDDITEIEIDFSKPFTKWNDTENDTIKAIIPVTHEGTRKLWWLNIRNPIYPEVIHAGRNGVTHFRILQTGTGKKTTYKLK